MDELVLRPIATIRGGRQEVADDAWGGEVADIVLAEWLPDGVLDGLGSFSHLEVVFLFDRVDPATTKQARRHPRGNTALPLVGALAQRHKDRPGRIGLSRCRILEVSAREVTVQGLDAVDGTPVLDIKPWFAAFGPQGDVEEPAWVAEVVRSYW
jgi:tRNA (adenine37-N6)-methyltransferase